MKRPADEDILSFIGLETKVSSDIYDHFGCANTSDRNIVLRALTSLVSYKRLIRYKGFDGKYYYVRRA